MKKSFLTSLCALCTLFFIPSAVKATDYTMFEDATTKSVVVPICLSNGNGASAGSFYGSITQQIYLASELSALGASAGDITSLTFYYSASNADAEAVERDIVIYLMASSFSEYEVIEFPRSGYGNDYQSYFLCDDQNKAGLKVYSGKLSTEGVSTSEIKEKKLNFNVANFPWNGTSNIVMTVVDKTASTHDKSNLRFIIGATKTGVSPSQTNHPRFAHTLWTNDSDERVSWITDGNYNFSGKKADVYGNSTSQTGQEGNRSWVNKVKFSISVPVVPDVPTGLVASSVGTTSASLSWNNASGATSYDLYTSTTIDGVYSKFASSATNSYEWSGLTANTTYYVKVAAVNGAGSSALSGPISFTTLAPHIHDGITFEPWSNPSAMPMSGNYYLATDVAYDFYAGGYLDLAGDLNLCLNGHTINLGTKSINVTNNKTMTIFDHIGGGKITGFVPGQDGIYTFQGVISVENNGTLVLREGEVENTYPADDDPEYKSIAIAVGGTLILSGAPGISSNEIDIYLPPTIPAKVITIESGKPLTNTTPYKVYKSSGVITSGWANMIGADPKDYFVSANSEKSICLNEGEAALRELLNLSENSNNSSIGTHYNQVVDVNLTRSLTSAQYNTFCLPFALSAVQMAEFFGAGYDLEELTSSSLEEEILTLTFERKYELEAGKPYLLQPSIEVVNPSFEGVTITANMPDTIETTYADLRAIYRPTELAGDNHNLLFLGEDNTLFWPESTGNMNAFRAYFVVKGAAANAVQARIGRAESQTTAIDNQKSHIDNHKYMKDGQLFIERNGVIYNAQGQTIK